MGRYGGKRVVITGGTSGIGLAAARLLLDEGARVLVTGQGAASLAAARDATGNRLIAVESDAASVAAIDDLVERVRDAFGEIDALLVCAGLAHFSTLAETTEGDYDRLLAVNAKGPFFLMQRLGPVIVAGGSIAVVTSSVDVQGLPMVGAYAASKAALRSMVRSAAREFLARSIRVNAVSPGPVDSGILEKTLSPEAAAETRDRMIANIPMGRFGRPEEVAAALAFLAFEASFTTGAELVVDGGSTQI